MVVAWLLTLPAAGIVGAICWTLAYYIGGLAGVLVVFTLLIALATVIYRRSLRDKVSSGNVNAPPGTGLGPGDTSPAQQPRVAGSTSEEA
jgi:PiT family inorganic phosphate transporter